MSECDRLHQLEVRAPGIRRPLPIPAQGSKNCFNHLLPAAFAGEDLTLTLHNTPAISDRDVAGRMLAGTGVATSVSGSRMTVRGGPRRFHIPRALGMRMRVTVCYAAALAARLGTAVFPLSGGDAFTMRPIDVHLRVLEAAGARWHTRDDGMMAIHFDRPPRPITVDVNTVFGPSMGASATALVVAALANGLSTVTGLSVEPEILGLVQVLRQVGVEITFDAVHAVRVAGVGGPLTGNATATVPADRMEAGTYLLAGLMMHERVTVDHIRPDEFPEGFRAVLDAAGVDLTGDHATTAVRRALRPVHVVTGPHPGFPTDLQPQMAAFLTQVGGTSSVTETIYPSRTTHVAELARLGIDIPVTGRRQHVHGRQRPRGGSATATDIRCGAAVLVAAAAAREPVLLADPAGQLARGYGDLGAKLARLGIVLRPSTSNLHTVG